MTWDLFEVVRDQLISVTHPAVDHRGGDTATESTVDLAALVSLRINGNGDPSTVLTGDARQRVVESMRDGRN